MNTARSTDWIRDRRAWPLAVIGLLLIVSGLAHLLIWLFSWLGIWFFAWDIVGGPWEGPVTWRKPILFGISGGTTSLSLGWAWSKLPWRWGDARLAAITAWALLVEVFLIDLQAWRGVASHFNRSTPLDSFLYDLMGVLILWVTLVVVDITVRCFRQPTGLAPDMLLAVRAGLVLLVIACLLGIWVSINGDLRQAAGLEPERYGVAGVPKFPHGAVIHAIQLLPMLAWGARWAGLSEGRRVRLLAVATAGTAMVGTFALVQTLLGRSRFDVTPATGALLAVGGLCLIVPLIPIAVVAMMSVLASGNAARR